jgi:hypothetical protein
MDQTQSSVGRFVRRVYRRLIVLRLLEWTGVGFAAGCGVALLMIPLLRKQIDSPLNLAGIIAAIGAAIGFIAAALRRPKVLEAAIEADRQLDLADLLATAWSLEKSNAKEDFELAVLTIAQDRAANLRPASVVLHRLGMRAWGGIGLAGALLLTVAILTANPLETDASLSPLLTGNAQNNSKTAQGGGQHSDTHRPPLSPPIIPAAMMKACPALARPPTSQPIPPAAKATTPPPATPTALAQAQRKHRPQRITIPIPSSPEPIPAATAQPANPHQASAPLLKAAAKTATTPPPLPAQMENLPPSPPGNPTPGPPPPTPPTPRFPPAKFPPPITISFANISAANARA